MRLYIFKSESNPKLQAFSPDAGGENLPVRHGPWTAVGIVPEDREPPHRISRTIVEKSIADQGFQLFQKKNTA